MGTEQGKGDMIDLVDVTTLVPRYKSDDEKDFANLGPTILQNHFHAAVLEMRYEPVRFKVPGGSYRPDFLVLLAADVVEHARIVFVEVKGAKQQRGYRDSISKLRAVAELYPWWTWVLVWAKTWEVEEVV